MEGDCEIRYLSKVFELLFLNAHSENLTLFSCVNQVISNLLHASNGEEGGRVLFFKISVPFRAIVCLYLEG